jgi:hypothetical protein
MSTQSVSLPLDQPRVVSIKHGEKKFLYKFRRIVDRDWKKYYGGIVSQTEVVNNEQARTFDFRTSLQVLVEDTLESVEGYTGKGGVSVDQLKDWKMKLPIGHKTNVGYILSDVIVDRSTAEDISVIGDLTEISLSATWSADESGKMVKYLGLVHRFQHPTIEQMRRFYRESSRTRVVGGSRTGKTIWTGRQELLALFYDELIESVDGYSVNGASLTDVRDIRAQMDTHHKVTAAQALFSGGDEAEPEAAVQTEEAR